MKATVRNYRLELRHTFTIARESKSYYDSIMLELEWEGLTGLGEAVPTKRYSEDAEGVAAALKGIDFTEEPFDDPFRLEDVDVELRSRPGITGSAIAAVNIAYWDLIGKRAEFPLYRLWGLDRDKTPVTSFTIGIDTPDVIRQKVREAEPYPLLKVKQGLDNDREIIETIREETDKTLRVDANEGWTRDEALEKIEWLAERGVEFVEQPLPADRLDDTAWLRERSPLPIVADENCETLAAIPKIAYAFDGINIKLMKCGGPSEALRMIHTARAHGLKIMLGCMIESSIAIAAAAHLSPLVDWADLDGNILTVNDPYTGIGIEDGKLILPDASGLGIKPIRGE